MDLTYEELKQQRLQKLFNDCQQQGLKVEEICRQNGISSGTYYN